MPSDTPLARPCPSPSWSMSHQELRDELHHAGENHDEDRVPVKLSEHHEGDQEPGAHADVEGAREAECREENQEPCSEDEGDDRRAERFQDALQETQLPVLRVDDGDDRDDDAARQNVSEGRRDGTERAAHLEADEGGGVDRDRAGGHLGDRDEIGEVRHADPVIVVHDLLLDQRHRGIAAAEAEGTDAEKSEEKLEIDHDFTSSFLFRQRVTATPRAMTARMIQIVEMPRM